MLRAHWLKKVGELCRLHPSKNTTGLTKRRPPAVASQPAEVLEQRSMLSVSALFVDGEVNLVSDGEDAIRVSASATGNLVVETGSVVLDAQGLPTAGTNFVPLLSLPTIPATDVTSLIIEGSDQENVIDVSPLTAAVFTNLQSIEIDGQNGDDLLTASADIASGLYGGDGNDTLIGGAASDTLRGGDGNDVIAGDTGFAAIIDTNDTVLVLGPGVRLVSGSTVSTVGDDEVLTVFQGAQQSVSGAGTALFDLDGIPNDPVPEEVRVLGPDVDLAQFPDLAGTRTIVGIPTVSNTDPNSTINFVFGDQAHSARAIGNVARSAAREVQLKDDGSALVFGLTTNGSADSLIGGDGDDLIVGSVGTDTINSGDGNDTVFAGEGSDVVSSQNGSDQVFGDAGNDTLNGDGGNDTVSGGDGDDSILGGELGDSLQGDAGNDILRGQAGPDVINGGTGDDSLLGDGSSDTLNGDDGEDQINAGGGNDEVHGGSGNDSILAGAGSDAVDGEDGNDTIRGQAGDDFIRGGIGEDSVDGGAGRDTIRGNPPGISISDAIVREGDANFVTARFTVSLTESPDLPVTISYRTEDDSAFINDDVVGQTGDYRRTSGTLTFQAGETTKTIDVLVNGDLFGERNEQFRVILFAPVDGTPTNALILDDTGIGTIENDPTDSIARISISSAAPVVEGTPTATVSDARTARFSLNLAAPVPRDVSVDVRTVSGTAGAGTDFGAVITTVTIPAGQTQLNIDVTTTSDNVTETPNEETFGVVIQPTSLTDVVDVARADAIIVDDDQPGVRGNFAILNDPANPNTIAAIDPNFPQTPLYTIPGPVGVALNATGVNGLAYDGDRLYLVAAPSSDLYTLDVNSANLANPIPPWQLLTTLGGVSGVIRGLACLGGGANVQLFALNVQSNGNNASSILEYDPNTAMIPAVLQPVTEYVIELLSTLAFFGSNGGGARTLDQSLLGLAAFENGAGANDRLYVLNQNTIFAADGDTPTGTFRALPNVDVLELQLVGATPTVPANADIVDYWSATYRESQSSIFFTETVFRYNLGTPVSIGAVRDPANPAAPDPIILVGTNEGTDHRLLPFTTFGQIENTGATITNLRQSDVQSVPNGVEDLAGDFNITLTARPTNLNATLSSSLVPLVATSIPLNRSEPIVLTSGLGDGNISVGVDELGAFGTSIFTLSGTANSSDAFFDPITDMPVGTTFESGVALRLGIQNTRDFMTLGNIGGSSLASAIPVNPTIVTRTASSVETQFSYGGFDWTLVQTVAPAFDRNNQQIGSVLTQNYVLQNTAATDASIEFARYLDSNLVLSPVSSILDGGGVLTSSDGRQYLFTTDFAGQASVSDNYVAVTAYVEGATDGTLDPSVVQHFDIDAFANVRGRITSGSQLLDAVTGDVRPLDGFVDALRVQSLPAQVSNAYDVTTGLSSALVVAPQQTLRYVTQTFFANGAPQDLVINRGLSAASNDSLSGGTEDDFLLGVAGDSTISGGAGNDLILAGPGNNVLLGGAGNDALFGNDGDDLLLGQGGADTLDGGAGNDSLVWRGEGNDSFLGTAGFDRVLVQGGDLADTFSVSEVLTFVTGSSTLVSSDLVISNGATSLVIDDTTNSNFSLLNVEIHGDDANDQVTVGNINHIGRMRLSIFGEEGNDLLDATGAQIGNVRLLLDGDDGDDTLKGSLGNDTLLGQKGQDSLMGRAGNDTLDGGLGDDTLAGEDGDDVLLGQDGHDLLVGQNGNDSISGGFGSDRIDGGVGSDTLRGGVGDDSLNGGAGNDLMFGDSGQDQLLGGAGDDSLDGGRNNDTLNGNSGNDSLIGNHGDDLLIGADGNDTLQGSDGQDTLDAGAGNNALNGGHGNDLMRAGDGDDTLLGNDGNDTLLAGGGQDIALGEDGDDVVNGQGGTDTVAGNQGNDNVADAVSEINELFSLPVSTLTRLFKSLVS